jgi:hypothetical protein
VQRRVLLAGRVGGSRPWSAEDLADLEINVEATVEAAAEAAAEWQQKVRVSLGGCTNRPAWVRMLCGLPGLTATVLCCVQGKDAKMEWEFSQYFGSLSDTSSQQASAASSPDTMSLSTAAALDISSVSHECE